MKKTALLLIIISSQFGFSQTWNTNIEVAKIQAIQENKNILLVFSGSDWCGPCIKLDKKVWQSDAFKNAASKSWILLKADFPKKKAHQLSVELTEQNNKLAEKYNKSGNFPLVVLLDKNGRVLGYKGFLNLDAEQYINEIYALEKK